MQSSDIPSKFPIPFADSAGTGYIRTIPEASQIGITNGAASLTDGFPPVTFLPVGAGGTPPWGQDFNGLLNQITQWSRWQNAGALVTYDATFSTAVGGYPKGAIVASATASGSIWMSTADNNTTNPDGLTPANWVLITPTATTITTYSTAGTYTFTVPANKFRVYGTCVGAGGGAGGVGQNASAGAAPAGGGGSGGSAEGWISVTPGQTITIIVGAGGAGGAASANTPSTNGSNGTAGGTSSIGAFMSATGGAAGQGGPSAGGAGGSGSGGQINKIGGNGTDGGGTAGTPTYGGNGGASAMGGGGRASTVPSSIQNGTAPGSGGGSVYNLWNASGSGGAGAAGLVILQY
ncbi:MAG TPA: hypothetical protein VGC14_02705 [Rhizobium sp.]